MVLAVSIFPKVLGATGSLHETGHFSSMRKLRDLRKGFSNILGQN